MPDPVDPFDALFDDDAPVTPRAAFAEDLRRRMTDALFPDGAPTRGEPMSTDTDTVPINHGSLFYFTIPGPDPDASARFYATLFGWDLHRGEQGYHVANVYPPMGINERPGPHPEVWIEVDDIQAAVARIRELGGEAEDPVHYDSGWSSACRDPQGVNFSLSVPTESYRQPARRTSEPGELFYWTLPAPDADASRRFFAEVFGWEYGDPGNQGGMHVSNRLPDGGLGGGREGAHPEMFFRVADLDAAMATVRELGGTAEPAGEGPEGRHARCVDDQGIGFGISEPAGA